MLPITPVFMHLVDICSPFCAVLLIPINNIIRPWLALSKAFVSYRQRPNTAASKNQLNGPAMSSA